MPRRIALLLLALSPALTCFAQQEPAAAPDATTLDAVAILRQATEKIKQTESLAVDLDLNMKVGLPGFMHEKGSRYKVAAERPNRLLLLRTRGDMGGTLATDGQKMTQYISELHQYTEGVAPRSLDEISTNFSAMSLIGSGMGGTFLVLLGDSAIDRLTDGATASQVVGVETIDGVECYRLRLEKEISDLDIWVTKDETHAIRRMSSDFSKQFAEEEDAEGFEIVVTMNLRAWDWQPEFDEQTFAYAAPASAELVEEFSALAPDPLLPPIASAPKHHPLLGELAPEFALVELSGNSAFVLKPLIGKKVIVLDFWATWCGPCRQGLPSIAELGKDYKDKPVAVYAVNIQEDADTIKAFLEESKLELNVLRDVDGGVATKYQASGIPQTVLIGLDGRVQVVHVGVTAKEELTEQLDALLNHEDLATKALNGEQAEAEAQPAEAQDSESEAPAESEDTEVPAAGE